MLQTAGSLLKEWIMFLWMSKSRFHCCCGNPHATCEYYSGLINSKNVTTARGTQVRPRKCSFAGLPCFPVPRGPLAALKHTLAQSSSLSPVTLRLPPHRCPYRYRYRRRRIYHIFLVHSSVDGHLSDAHTVTTASNAAMNTGCRHLSDTVVSFPSDTSPEVELLITG